MLFSIRNIGGAVIKTKELGKILDNLIVCNSALVF